MEVGVGFPFGYFLPSLTSFMKDEFAIPSVSTAALYVQLFKALPNNSILLCTDAPRYTIVATTPKYLKEPGTKSEDLIGKGVFEAFPSNPDEAKDTGARALLSSLEHVLKYREPHQLPMQRYDSVDEKGPVLERYWKASNSPVLNDDSEVIYIVHTAEEITDKIIAEKRKDAIRDIEKAYNLFMSAPVILCIVKGEDPIIELANEGMLKVWGRTSEVVGKPLLQVIPEMKGQGFIELLELV
jgi:PAS domain-containing protein